MADSTQPDGQARLRAWEAAYASTGSRVPLQVLTQRPMAEWREPAWSHGALRNYTDLDPTFPLMPYGRDSSKSMMMKAVLGKDGVKSVSLLPMVVEYVRYAMRERAA